MHVLDSHVHLHRNLAESARANPLFLPWVDSEGTEGFMGGSESFTCHSDGER